MEYLQSKPYGLMFFLYTFELQNNRFQAMLPGIFREWSEITPMEAVCLLSNFFQSNIVQLFALKHISTMNDEF